MLHAISRIRPLVGDEIVEAKEERYFLPTSEEREHVEVAVRGHCGVTEPLVAEAGLFAAHLCAGIGPFADVTGPVVEVVSCIETSMRPPPHAPARMP